MDWSQISISIWTFIVLIDFFERLNIVIFDYASEILFRLKIAVFDYDNILKIESI